MWALSPSLRRFWGKVGGAAEGNRIGRQRRLWLEEVLQQEEIDVAGRLDRTRLFVRIGPMLGLAGTIILLGRSTVAAGGRYGRRVNHLWWASAPWYAGLVMSGVSYFITLVRERWTRVELKRWRTCANWCCGRCEPVGGRSGRSRMKAFVRRRRALDSLASVHREDPLSGVANLFDPRSFSRFGLMVALIQAFSLAQFLDPNSQVHDHEEDARTGQVELIEKDRREIKVKKMTPEKKGGPACGWVWRINCRTGACLRARERGRGKPSPRTETKNATTRLDRPGEVDGGAAPEIGKFP